MDDSSSHEESRHVDSMRRKKKETAADVRKLWRWVRVLMDRNVKVPKLLIRMLFVFRLEYLQVCRFLRPFDGSRGSLSATFNFWDIGHNHIERFGFHAAEIEQIASALLPPVVVGARRETADCKVALCMVLARLRLAFGTYKEMARVFGGGAATLASIFQAGKEIKKK